MLLFSRVVVGVDPYIHSYTPKVENDIEWVYRTFEYPPAIRKVIYTTNAIESLNSGLRKVTKGKGAFINETALMKVLYLRVQHLQKKWSK